MGEYLMRLDKELYRYRHLVHCYLDVLWLIATDKSKARKSWYNYLAVAMGKDEKNNHISRYSLEDCKKALKILKSKYKQMTGKSNMPKELINKFYKNEYNKYDKELFKNKKEL